MISPEKINVFISWFDKLRDIKARAKNQIQRLADGNVGDVQPVGEGAPEMGIVVNMDVLRQDRFRLRRGNSIGAEGGGVVVYLFYLITGIVFRLVPLLPILIPLFIVLFILYIKLFPVLKNAMSDFSRGRKIVVYAGISLLCVSLIVLPFSFELAMYFDTPFLIRFPVLFGLNPDRTYGQDGTPLFRAVEAGNSEMVASLLDAGADPNTKFGSGLLVGGSTLQEAIQDDHREICRLLISNGADLNYMNLYGDTLLTGAINFERSFAALELIKGGADVNLKNRHGQSPLQVAERMGLQLVTKALEEHGAK